MLKIKIMNKVKPLLFSFNLSLTSFFFIIILFFFISSTYSYSQEKFKIVLDAGHGGKDPGRPNKNGIKEKNIVLNIALLLGKKLEKLVQKASKIVCQKPSNMRSQSHLGPK